MQGKTVICHCPPRCATLAAMDMIDAVMDKAGFMRRRHRIAELLAQGGLYAQLWARQSGGLFWRGRTLKNVPPCGPPPKSYSAQAGIQWLALTPSSQPEEKTEWIPAFAR